MKKITYIAMIAALYAGLTICLAPISFGLVQCRIAEAMTVLPLFSPSAIPGLFIGCFLANLYTGNILDIIAGSIATLIAACCTYIFRKNKWIAVLFPVIVNAVIVGGYLGLFIDASQPVWLYMLTVGAGQAVACYGLGIPLHSILKKIEKKIIP